MGAATGNESDKLKMMSAVGLMILIQNDGDTEACTELIGRYSPLIRRVLGGADCRCPLL